MFVLIEISSGKIVTENVKIVKLGGEWQWSVDKGLYEWFEVPTGEEPGHCILQDGKLAVDIAKKDARAAALNSEIAIRQDLSALAKKSSLTAAEANRSVLNLLKLMDARKEIL